MASSPAPAGTMVVRESPSPPVVRPPFAAPVAPVVSPPNPVAHYTFTPAGAPLTAPRGAILVPVYVAVPPALPNGVGTAGFVVGLISVFLPLIFGLFGGLVGLVLSIVGLALPQRRRGLAIAGLILSILAIILII